MFELNHSLGGGGSPLLAHGFSKMDNVAVTKIPLFFKSGQNGSSRKYQNLPLFVLPLFAMPLFATLSILALGLKKMYKMADSELPSPLVLKYNRPLKLNPTDCHDVDP